MANSLRVLALSSVVGLVAVACGGGGGGNPPIVDADGGVTAPGADPGAVVPGPGVPGPNGPIPGADGGPVGPGPDPGTDGGPGPAKEDSGTTPPAPGAKCDDSKQGGGGPNGGPADLFPCDSPWYRDVSAAAVSPESAGIVDSIGAFGTGQFRIDFSIVFMHADAASPRKKFTVEFTEDSNTDAVPIPVGGALEEEDGYTCTGGGDCHLLVIDDANKKLFELWSVQNASGPYEASQQTTWDLAKKYGPEGRGLGCTSADAAGFPIVPGVIGLRETRAGVIRHALRFILPNAKIRKGPSFIAPATHGTAATTSVAGPPYGSRLRLKSSFDASKIKTSGGKAIVQALKTYGMYLADGGNYALTAENDRLQKAKDPTQTWEGVLGGSNDVVGIQPTDFEVVEFGTIKTTNDCTLL